MKYKILLLVLLFSSIYFNIQAQENTDTIQCKLGIKVGIAFHSFALPFYDLKSNISNPCATIAYEIALNKRKNLIFQTNTAFVFNKNLGNNLQIYPELLYRPHFGKKIFAEVKFGIGWQLNFSPVSAFENVNGIWVNSSSSKSQLIVPVGFSLGYISKFRNKTISPVLSYQTIPSLFYDATIPLNFYSMISFGLIYNF